MLAFAFDLALNKYYVPQSSKLPQYQQQYQQTYNSLQNSVMIHCHTLAPTQLSWPMPDLA